MSDLAATGCGNNDCGCSNNRSGFLCGGNDCCSLIWIILLLSCFGNNGGGCGWIAGNIMKTGYSLIMNVLLGLVGGVLGGFIFGLLGFAITGIIGSIISGVVGSCLIIFIVRKIKK